MLVDVGCSLLLLLIFAVILTIFLIGDMLFIGVRICSYDGTAFYVVLGTITRIFSLFNVQYIRIDRSLKRKGLP